MDIVKKLPALLLRNKYAVGILLLGLVLLMIPSKKETVREQVPTEEASDLSTELAHILGSMDGVGEVEVLISIAAGERTQYQLDGNGDTVILSGADREESALAQQTLPPVYQGAVIVCQGADSPSVRLSVVEAVAGITGLSTDRIIVVKMK